MEDLGLLDCWTEVRESKDTGEECKVPALAAGHSESQIRVREEMHNQQGNTSKAEGANERDEDGEPVLGSRHRDRAQRERDLHSTAAERGRKKSPLHAQRSTTANVERHLFHEEDAAALSPAQSGLPSRGSPLLIPSTTACSSPFSPVECCSSETTASSVFDQHPADTDTATSAPLPAAEAVRSSGLQFVSCSAASSGVAISAGTSTVWPSCTTGPFPSVSSPASPPYRLPSATGCTSAVTDYDGSPSVTTFSSSVETPGEGGQAPTPLARTNRGVVSSCSSPSPSPSQGAAGRSVASFVSDIPSHSNNAPVSHFSPSGETSPQSPENAGANNTTASPSGSSRTQDTPVPVSLSASPVCHIEGRGRQTAEETSCVGLSLEEGKALSFPLISSRWRERVTGAVWTAASCLLPSGMRWQERPKQGDANDKQGDGSFLGRRELENQHPQVGPLSPAPLRAGTGSCAYTEEREASYSQSTEAVCLKAACSLEDFNVRSSPLELRQVEEPRQSSLLTTEEAMKVHGDMNVLLQDKTSASKWECARQVGHEHIEEVVTSAVLGSLAGSSICTSTPPSTLASERGRGESSTGATTPHLRSYSRAAPHDSTRDAHIPLERRSNDVHPVVSPGPSSVVACSEASLPASSTERSIELSTPYNNTDAVRDNLTSVAVKGGSTLLDKGAGAVDLARSEASPSRDSPRVSEVSRPTDTLFFTDDDSVHPSFMTTRSAWLSDTVFGTGDPAGPGLKGEPSTTTTNSSEYETNEFTRNLFLMHTDHPDEGQKPSGVRNVLSNVVGNGEPCESESEARRLPSPSRVKKDSAVSLERGKRRTVRGRGRAKETRRTEAIKAENASGDQLEKGTTDQGERLDIGERTTWGRPCRKRKERGAATSPSAARTT